MKKGTFVVNKVSPSIQDGKKEKMEVGLEEALDIAGTGKYQVCHFLLMVLVLSSALLEIVGSAFVLPAAACDLEIPENLKGLFTCIPNIGIILTAALWGRAADSLGRKPSLLSSTAGAGALGSLAAFMPNLTSYALCKLAASFFLSCPSSLSFAFGGEVFPRRRRDLAVLMLSAFLMVASTLSPVLAWLILPYEWNVTIGSLTLRPWRLLTIVYSTPLLISALFLLLSRESPKFLVSKGKNDKALIVLQNIYSRNTGLSVESYPVTSLKPGGEGHVEGSGSDEQLTDGGKGETMIDLLKPPHLKWMSITGLLMFGIFCLLNGLFLFAPDTINKAMSSSDEEEGTICLLLQQSNNLATNATECDTSISSDTFSIMVITTFIYALLVLVASLSPLSKKTLLVTTFLVVGVACLMSGLVKNRIVAAVAMSALQLTALGIGPLTAYAVRLFPTGLRGTAMGALMMFGRLGSIAGANVAGLSLAVACDATFYGFSILLFVCACLSFTLPKTEDDTKKEAPSDTC